MSITPSQFAVIVSDFNDEVTSRLLQGALTRFKECDIAENNIHVFHVPGAVEIPLIAKLLAKQQQYQAILCLGAVIRGDTDHYDYVCQQVSQGCQKVMLKFDIPVIFGVLTTNNVEQALARAGGTEGNKGADSVDAAIKMVHLINTIPQ